MNRLITPLILVSILVAPLTAWSQEPEKTFSTKYTTIRFVNDKDMDDFLWRLGGQRLDFTNETELVSNRIDRIVERVQAILDMRPVGFHVVVGLQRELPGQYKAAYYDPRKGTIYVAVDYATDGVLAHEIAHAVINRYFASPPPSKVQEILTQYVDRYLWSDY